MGFNDLVGTILDTSKNHFGETIRYRPYRGSEVEITGIFDEVYTDVDVDGEVTSQSQTPVCGVKLADLIDEPKENDTLVAKGVEYRIIEIQKDGRVTLDSSYIE